jgi:molybdate transport system substrate-binding protein
MWEGVKARLIRAENVRASLALVSRGEAPLGIVYASDAAIDPSVIRVAEFPKNSHPPIIYPAALVKSGASAEAQAFLDYLKGPEAAAIFHVYGFPLK